MFDITPGAERVRALRIKQGESLRPAPHGGGRQFQPLGPETVAQKVKASCDGNLRTACLINMRRALMFLPCLIGHHAP